MLLKNDVQYQEWIDSGGTLDFPESESRKHFMQRCKKGWIRMCNALWCLAEQDAGSSIKTGIIAHGGTIMALLSSYGKKCYFDCQVPNGKGYLCRMDRWRDGAALWEGSAQIKEVAEL